MRDYHAMDGTNCMQALSALLAESSLDMVDGRVLITLGNMYCTPGQLVDRTVWFADPCEDDVAKQLSAAEVLHSLASLIDRELIAVVTRQFQQHLEQLLQDTTDLLCSDWLPPEGHCEFTESGARLMCEIDEQVFKTSPNDAVQDFTSTDDGEMIIGTTPECVEQGVKDTDQVMPISPITSVGPWRDRWWRRYAVGYGVLIRYVND